MADRIAARVQEAAAKLSVDLQTVQGEVAQLDAAQTAEEGSDNEPQRRPPWNQAAQETAAYVIPLETAAMLTPQPDPTVKPHLLERNIADAARCAEVLFALRREFTDLARSYVELRTRFEEFVRTDAIEQMEDSAGSYELAFREARLDAEQSLNAVSAYGIAARNTERLFRLSGAGYGGPGPLTEAGRDAQIEAARTLSGDPSATLTTYRFKMEYSSAAAAIRGYKAAEASTRARHGPLTWRLPYAKKNIDFLRFRAAAAREAAASRYYQHLISGSALNYEPRLKALRQHYEATLAQLLSRVDPIIVGAKALYGVILPVPTVNLGSAADNLATWLLSVNELLRPALQTERAALVPVALSSLGANWRNDLAAGSDIPVPDTLAQGAPSRLRGVCAELVSDQSEVIGLELRSPTVAGPWAGALPPEPQVVKIGRSTYRGLAERMEPEHSQILWNQPPWGDWNCRLVHGRLDNVSDVILWLFVAY